MSASVFVPLRLKRLGKFTVDAEQRELSPALLRALFSDPANYRRVAA